ncbi:MAG: polysaccharide biosynthesis tyrosine autokinase [Candidatus Cloacimonadota bacterium]|nr:MAG: polysaccharide biosynthesis tyrosine autokinase [Candidatus Cloacimonadota bacterium]
MNEEKIDIRAYVAIVLRRKWIVLTLFLVTFLSTLYFTLRKPPVYESKATVIIKQLPTAIPGMDFGYSKANYITNHTLILKSRTLMGKVAENFTSEEMESAGISKLSSIVGIVSSAITINPVKGSDIIEIKSKTDKPYSAALFANKVAETYIHYNIEDKRREVKGVREFAEEQMELVEEQLKKAEDDICNYQKTHKVFGLKKETEAFIEQIAELQTLYEKARIERKGVEKNLEAVKSQLTIEQKEFLETSTDISLPLLKDLKISLSTLEKEKASLIIQAYDEKDPKIREINSKIGAIKSKMNETIVSVLENRGQIDALTQVQELLLQSISLQISIEVAKAKELAYRGVLGVYEGKFSSIPSEQIELARMERQRKANEKIYMMLLEKAEEAKISEASEIGTVSMLDRALLPKKEIRKQKITNIMLGFIMGLIISIGVAFVIEYFDTSIKSIEDVEKTLKMPLLASIPSIRSNGKKDEISVLQNKLITHQKPRSHISESYRSLRTNLQFASVDGGIKTVVVTSPAPREGKTLTASNLAIAQAQAGRKTLLLDTDLRRPMIHRLFNLKKEDGISKVLTGELKLDDAIKKTDIENLSVITSGPIPPNPSELLASRKMKDVLKELRGKFDKIVMDSPPLIAVTDPIVLGKEVDGMVFVVRSGKTVREIAEKSLDNAKFAKIKLLGCVLNDVDVRHIYGSYNYYYYYYYYSEDEGKKGKKRHRKRA